ALKRLRPNSWFRSPAHFRKGIGLGVASLLAVLPSLAWVWWISPSFVQSFCILALGILSWNSLRGLVYMPAERHGVPLRVFLDLGLVAIGHWLYLEIRQRIETGNIFGAALNLGVTAPVLLLSALALRSYLLH